MSRGRQIILNRGLQLSAMIQPDYMASLSLFSQANFTTFSTWAWPGLANLPVVEYPPLPNVPWLDAAALYGKQWSRAYHGQSGYYLPRPREVPYADNLFGFQFYDERDQTQAVLDEEKAAYADWHSQPHLNNSMIYTNFAVASGYGPTTLAALKQYVQHTNPDMLSFDYYPQTWSNFSTSSRNKWYSDMQMYRTAGLAGYDNTGTSPVPYAQYLDLWRESYADALPTESFVRLQQNASWAFGYSMVTAHVYNDWMPTDMFSSPGDNQPTATFYHVAEANRQSFNLGPALVRLVSTDIRMIKGSAYSSLPDGISPWANNAVMGVTPLGNDGGASGVHGDVLIGFFKPLLDNNANCTFINGTNFMIVNGAATGAAAASAESYLLNFNFSGTSYDSLARLSRNTGELELIPLTYTGGWNYKTVLTLEGGTGDLFAFWDSRGPLPTIPEPDSLVILAAGLMGVLVYGLKSASTLRGNGR